MSDMKVILKENIPEFLRVYPHLEGYLEAIGESFQIKRQYINDFEFARDPVSATDFGVDRTLKSIGFEIPENIKPNIRRNIMRDAMNIFARKGTTDSLVWALRAIGIQPSIRQAWLPSPDSVMRGKIIDPITGEESEYNIDAYSYNDFLYGDIDVTPEGNFFKGYRYNDPREEVEISGLPIRGEVYSKHPTNYTCDVVKVPYIAIRIDDENFNVVTGPYTDEEGQYYEYGVSEEFQSAIDLIEYFLYDLVRPTPVRILLVSSAQTLGDVIGVTSDCTQKYEDEELFETDVIDVDDIDGSGTDTPVIANFPVGENPMIMGTPCPYYDAYMGLPVPGMGEGGESYRLVHGEDMGTRSSSYPLKTNVKVPFQGKTILTVPANTEGGNRLLKVFTINEWDSQVPKFIRNVTNAEAVFEFMPQDGVAFYIARSDGIPDHVNINITYTFE